MVRWDSNPHPLGQLRPNAFTIWASYQTFRKNWWLRLPSSTWVCLIHFSIFFWEISSWSNVNLVLNHTILSFKVKKLLTTYLSPLIFLNHKKQTHKLNSQKTTRASGWIRTNVTFRFLITNQVQSTSMRRKPVYIITSATLGELPFPRCLSV